MMTTTARVLVEKIQAPVIRALKTSGAQGGYIDNETLVEITCQSPGALIFFTTDGSRVNWKEIGKSTHFFSRPFKLEAGRRMIKAVAVSKDEMRVSAQVSKGINVVDVAHPQVESKTGQRPCPNQPVTVEQVIQPHRTGAGAHAAAQLYSQVAKNGDLARRPTTATTSTTASRPPTSRDAFGLATSRSRPNTAGGDRHGRGMFGYVENPYKRDPNNSEIAAALEQQHAQEQLDLLQRQARELEIQNASKKKKSAPPVPVASRPAWRPNTLRTTSGSVVAWQKSQAKRIEAAQAASRGAEQYTAHPVTTWTQTLGHITSQAMEYSECNQLFRELLEAVRLGDMVSAELTDDGELFNVNLKFNYHNSKVRVPKVQRKEKADEKRTKVEKEDKDVDKDNSDNDRKGRTRRARSKSRRRSRSRSQKRSASRGRATSRKRRVGSDSSSSDSSGSSSSDSSSDSDSDDTTRRRRSRSKKRNSAKNEKERTQRPKRRSSRPSRSEISNMGQGALRKCIHNEVSGNGKGRADLIDDLLEAGAPIDSTGPRSKMTLPMTAAHNGHLEALHMFKDRGADLWCQNESDGNTALHYAIMSRSRNSRDIARLLLGRRARLKLKNDNGLTVLDLCKKHDRMDIRDMISKAQSDRVAHNLSRH